jgi:hypothetical protein
LRRNKPFILKFKQTDEGEDTVDDVDKQISRMKIAAEIPLKNYGRIIKILEKMEYINKMAALPQNATVRPHITTIVRKIAGVFAEVDNVCDLDKPLEQIEKAIAAIYKKPSSNNSCYFERRNLKNHPIRYNYDQK